LENLILRNSYFMRLRTFVLLAVIVAAFSISASAQTDKVYNLFLTPKQFESTNQCLTSRSSVGLTFEVCRTSTYLGNGFRILYTNAEKTEFQILDTNKGKLYSNADGRFGFFSGSGDFADQLWRLFDDLKTHTEIQSLHSKKCLRLVNKDGRLAMAECVRDGPSDQRWILFPQGIPRGNSSGVKSGFAVSQLQSQSRDTI